MDVFQFMQSAAESIIYQRQELDNLQELYNYILLALLQCPHHDVAARPVVYFTGQWTRGPAGTIWLLSMSGHGWQQLHCWLASFRSRKDLNISAVVAHETLYVFNNKCQVPFEETGIVPSDYDQLVDRCNTTDIGTRYERELKAKQNAWLLEALGPRLKTPPGT